MNNNSSQRRFARITSKVIVMLLAVVMCISVLPSLSADIFPTAEAAESYTVQSGATLSSINTQLASYPAGTVVDMKLMDNINITDTSTATFSSGITGIDIPSGITVNLFMNGKKIIFSRPSDGAYKLPYVYAVHNKGTLNIYSGSTVTATTTTAEISVVNVRDGMTCNEEKGSSYVALEAIRNEGTLTVNNKVAITVNAHTEYDEVKGSSASVNVNYCEQVTDAVAAIYNTEKASCVIKGAVVSSTAFSYPMYRTTGEGGYGVNATAIAYGIYGGSVSVSGGASITTSATAQAKRENCTGSNANDGRSKLTGISYGIVANGSVTVTGADINVNTAIWTDKGTTHNSSSVNHYTGGIYTLTGNVPVVPDANIKANTGSFSYNTDSDNNATIRYREGTVVTSNELPVAPTSAVESNIPFNEGYAAWPSEEVSASNFRDEAGNTYSTNMATSAGSHPTNVIRGALVGQNRVHVIYRYWTDNTMTTLDTSIVGNAGNAGYSYSPLTDGTDVVNSLISLNGVKATNILTKNPDAAISYNLGAESCNSYYWNFNRVVCAKDNSLWFSDINLSKVNVQAIKDFDEINPINTAFSAGDSPVYVFVDYIRLNAISLKASVGTAGVATTTYTGAPIKASAIGLTLVDSVLQNQEFTSEYNLDFTNSALIDVTYSYSGTNAAGTSETSESGQMPTNAGTYQVTLKIAESTTYDKNPNRNKNRYGLNYTFTLIIEQANALRGSLKTEYGLTYGQKLSEVLELSSQTAKAVTGDADVPGVFSFTNAGDGSTYKNVGSDIVSVTWTPTYGDGAITKNYKTTTFNVSYKVNKAPLTIKPNAASVVYGNTEFTVPFSVEIVGLVGNDTSDSARNTISAALNYMIQNAEGNYVPYAAGEIFAGTYYIRATFSDVPALLSNYDFSYVYGAGNNEEGVLSVTKRPVTVKASAIARPYEPENMKAEVAFEITEGRYGGDDVRISNAQGSVSNNNAGSRQVYGINIQNVTPLITGGAGQNYVITKLDYDTGNELYVTINKAVPTVTTPVVEERYYQNAATLGDIEFSGYSAAVAGEWQWVDETVNPKVNVTAYKAQYVPEDLDNYEIKLVDVAIKVKPTPVVISYTGTVSYGDNIPNITAYTYKADLDPSFSIDAVTTSGNITPKTTYVKGSPVVEGGYPVEISAPNFVDVNGNYTFTTSNGVITVKPRLITFTVEDATAVYGDNFVPSASTVTVSYDEKLLVGTDTIESVTASGLAPTFEYSTDFRYIDNYKVGTYYIKATPNFATSPNYEVATVQGTLRVTKAQLTIKADDITLEYGSEIPADIENAFSVVGAKRNETASDVLSSGSIKIDTTYEKNAPVNIDGYPVTIDVTNAVFDNYSVSVQHGVITVTKATPRVLTLPTAVIVHGQTLGDAVFTGGSVENSVEGKYVYNAAATAPAYRAEAYTIYTATFVPADTTNYNTVTGLYISLTVNKKPVSGTLAVAGVPMVGQRLTVDVTGLDPDEIGVYTLTWYDGSTQIGTGAELNLTESHKLKTLTVKAVANAPYTGEVVYVTTTIAPSLTSVETILTAEQYDTYFNLSGLSEYLGDAQYVYNAQPHYVEFQRDNRSLSAASIGDVTIKYNGSTTAPTKVGYYTVTVDIATPADVDLTRVQFVDGISTVDGKAVYSPVANYKIGTLVITQANYYVSVAVQDKVYDGTGAATAEVTDQYGACELVGGGYDDVVFDADAAVYYFASSDVGTDIDVFVNNAVLKGDAAENYELLIDIANNAKADITKRTLKVKVVPVEREYEANNYYVDLSFEPVANSLAAGDEGFVYVDEALVQGAIDNYRAGLRNVTVSGAVLTGAKAGNYELELTNLDGLTVEILKATPFYPIPMTDVLYYDSARPLNAVSLGDSRWTWDNEIANEVPGAGIHTYKAIYTPDDTSNYAIVEYDVEVEILKSVVTITAANFTVTYGDIEPTYYYSVTGLTGADTIKDDVDGYVLLNCSYQAGSYVGKYDIVLTGAFESENYDFIYKNGVVNVNKRSAYVEAIAADREYAPGNLTVDVTFSSLTNLYGADGANDVYLEGPFPVAGTIDNENAGIKTVKYTMPKLVGEKAGNYEIRVVNPTLTVEILKARTPGVVLPVTGIVGYGQKLSSTKFTSSYSGTEYGTFSMENPTTTPTEVGTFNNVYKVVFTPFNTQNYAVITEYITLTVEPSELNIAISFTGTAQSGKSLYIVTNDIPAGAQEYLWFEWYRVDSPTDDPRSGIKVASGTDAYTLTDADGGKYIICTVENKDGAPYTCYAKCVTDSAIEEVQLTFWQRLVNWFYKIISNITQIFGKIM